MSNPMKTENNSPFAVSDIAFRSLIESNNSERADIRKGLGYFLNEEDARDAYLTACKNSGIKLTYREDK